MSNTHILACVESGENIVTDGEVNHGDLPIYINRPARHAQYPSILDAMYMGIFVFQNGHYILMLTSTVGHNKNQIPIGCTRRII